MATGLPYREASVVRFSVDQPEQAEELYKHPAAVWAVATNRELTTLASTDYQGTLIVTPLGGGERKVYDKEFSRWTRALKFSPDGKQLVAGNEAGTLFVWALDQGKSASQKELGSGQIMSFAFSPSGNRLAIATGSGKLHVVAWPSLEGVKEFAIGDQPLWSVVFADNDEQLWVGSSDGKVRRVRLNGEPEEVGKLNDWVTSLAPLPSGGVLAVSLRGQIKRGASKDAKELSDWATGPNGMWCALSVPGERIVVGTRKRGPAIFQTVGQLKYAGKEPSDSAGESK